MHRRFIVDGSVDDVIIDVDRSVYIAAVGSRGTGIQKSSPIELRYVLRVPEQKLISKLLPLCCDDRKLRFAAFGPRGLSFRRRPLLQVIPRPLAPRP